jgi:hypothetical protein
LRKFQDLNFWDATISHILANCFHILMKYISVCKLVSQFLE